MTAHYPFLVKWCGHASAFNVHVKCQLSHITGGKQLYYEERFDIYKYICTIYTRLDTCLVSISRFSLRDKVTLRVLKLADVVDRSRPLDIRLNDWWWSVSMVWVEGRTKICQLKDLILTLWFNFQTYIFMNIPFTFQWVVLQCMHIWYAR